MQLSAQKTSSMQGEYYLRGVMETASGFKLDSDSTFQFFFSYGALDRYGSGTWKLVNGNVVLTSKPQPEKDFELIKSSKVPGVYTTLKVVDENPMILRYVNATFSNGRKLVEQTTDSEGIIQISKQPVDSIALIFRLCPDRYSTFYIPDSSANYFEFRIEPWIAEVFFNNFVLKVDGKNLTGKHPLLNGGSYVYER